MGPENPTPETAAVQKTAAGLCAAATTPPAQSDLGPLKVAEREHLHSFLDEAAEHMDAIEAGLLAIEADPSDMARINELFRPFHTIKGIAGFLNLRDISRLTHEIESLLDLGRKGGLRITADTIELLFTATDALQAQLAAIRQYVAASASGPYPQPDITEIMRRLQQTARSLPAANQPVAEERGPAPGGVGAAAGQPAPGKLVLDHSIRVDTTKLDTLVDAVGELVIAQSMVNLYETVNADDKLLRRVAHVTKIVRDVQAAAMAMRMVPIGQLFQKMRRLVRDVAHQTGKQAELTASGEETELDKSVIEQISDPLVHLIRNAVDHGIEPPEARRQLAKAAVGQVHLHARHEGDRMVIEIRDDGRGLDRDQLVAKAIERRLIGPGERLSEEQVFALILRSGFSTAEQVTNISGRGVGLDVVKQHVEQLRGTLEIASQKGHGSVFRMKLPLTLAIIDGMLARVGRERLVIPTILIEQSLRPERKQIVSVQQRGAMIQMRGELCPLVQLGALFGYSRVLDPCANLVVIVRCAGQRLALVVEELIGQQQVVIKTLSSRLRNVLGVAGAAILGDGRVGLILEPGGLLTLHTHGRDFAGTGEVVHGNRD